MAAYLRPVHVAQRAQAEPVSGAGVHVAVHHHGLAAARHLEDLADLGVQLEVGDGAPELGHGQLTHRHRGRLVRPRHAPHPAARAGTHPALAVPAHAAVLAVAERGAGGEGVGRGHGGHAPRARPRHALPGLAAVGLPAGAGLGGGLGRVEAGRHGHRPRAVRRLRGHGSGARARPLRVVRDGLAAVPVHVHPNTATVLLLILGEPIPALQPILNTIHQKLSSMLDASTNYQLYLYGQTGQVDAGADHPLVVVRVDADTVRLQIKCILTVLYILQLVLVEVGPPPDPGVDYMWESLPCGHLQRVSSDKTVS